ncbi:MAG: anhydro-N-acetylmuramic acid kinase [Candidatus Pelagibacter bacterium]|nr:anhydro-N-acetylmuramic acid kinase [Candidatus Pelagibacter bacterium]MBL6860903.1 anhydro-N-acetylmuramic acid kinase [Candidatus Pelagibacter bacterium]
MIKDYISLGLMSGTSGDGVDASIIQSNGETKYNLIKNKYFEYDSSIYQKIHNLKEKIHNANDLKVLKKDLKELERKITLFHAKVVKETTENTQVDLIGFHGQTIYHNSKEKISSQLGDGKLLSQLTKKKIIYNFRKNDTLNGGEGAPLTPIFHQLIATQLELNLPTCILNIGGISNVTIVDEPVGTYGFRSRDIGPGNCLIDSWVRKNSKYKFDRDGLLASSGRTNKIIYEQAQELFANSANQNKLSFDTNDFDVSFARGLSLEDGAATLTDFTARVIGTTLFSLLSVEKNKTWQVILCGGGRKNKLLIEKIKNNTLKNIFLKSIDDFGLDGDFIESQAFAFLAIRSLLKIPITFPSTTGCIKPSLGGELIKN